MGSGEELAMMPWVLGLRTGGGIRGKTFLLLNASYFSPGLLHNSQGAGAAGDCSRDTARVPERALAPEAPLLAAEDADWPSADVDCTSSAPVRATFLLGGFIVRTELSKPRCRPLLLRKPELQAGSDLLQNPVARRDAEDEGRREKQTPKSSDSTLKILCSEEIVRKSAPSTMNGDLGQCQGTDVSYRLDVAVGLRKEAYTRSHLQPF
jgi:hypothetical protein